MQNLVQYLLLGMHTAQCTQCTGIGHFAAPLSLVLQLYQFFMIFWRVDTYIYFARDLKVKIILCQECGYFATVDTEHP
jgi:hypothetical protein